MRRPNRHGLVLWHRPEQGLLHRLLRLIRQRRTFLAGAGDGLEQMNLNVALIIGKQTHQVREQIIVTNQRCERINLSIAQITDRHRLQRHLGINRAGQ